MYSCLENVILSEKTISIIFYNIKKLMKTIKKNEYCANHFF